MASEKRFRIGGKVYEGQSIQDITVEDAVMFDSYAAEAGWNVTLDEIEEMADKESPTIRESMMVLGVVVWLMRRAAGEDVTLAEAARVKASEVEEIGSPEDRKAPKAKSKKKSSQKDSARATGITDDPEVVVPLTSESRSATA